MLEYCQQLYDEQRYEELHTTITYLIQCQQEQESEISQKQVQAQENATQLDQLKKEEATLREYIEEQMNHLEKEKMLLGQIESEITSQRQKEIQLQMEQKHQQEQEQIYESQKETFMYLFNQCHGYHEQNQQLVTKIEELQSENLYLEQDLKILEGQADQKQKYIHSLKQLNQKTEETLQRLTLYQEELKKLMHLNPQQHQEFDPIQYIKSVSTAHREEEDDEDQEEENDENEDAQMEIDETIHYEENNNGRFIAIAMIALVGVYLIKRKWF